MKPPDWKSCDENELWRYVAWHLSMRGIDSVLVGGSVAAIYSEGAYRSGDFFKSRDALEQALLVAAAQPVDFKRVKKWCEVEKGGEQFQEFQNLLLERTRR
ncbi:MAG: hypothetical protein LBK71_02380 [Verrucomicrobiales bacterium]|jgi:hypothetical protein|nr:hypothetical protein [Verrucomicrobiales bacterium]